MFILTLYLRFAVLAEADCVVGASRSGKPTLVHTTVFYNVQASASGDCSRRLCSCLLGMLCSVCYKDFPLFSCMTAKHAQPRDHEASLLRLEAGERLLCALAISSDQTRCPRFGDMALLPSHFLQFTKHCGKAHINVKFCGFRFSATSELLAPSAGAALLPALQLWWPWLATDTSSLKGLTCCIIFKAKHSSCSRDFSRCYCYSVRYSTESSSKAPHIPK